MGSRFDAVGIRWDRQTDILPSETSLDPALHTMRAVPISTTRYFTCTSAVVGKKSLVKADTTPRVVIIAAATKPNRSLCFKM